MIKNFKEECISSQLFIIFISIAVIFGTSLLCRYSFYPKEFNGYYMAIGVDNQCHKIFVNWDNAPDDICYKTYNQEDLLRTFKLLKETE